MPNKAMITSRSRGDKAISALLFTAPDLATGKRAAIAMSRIYAYLRSARLQVRLIERYQGQALPKKPTYSANLIKAYTSAHLYFICWAAIRRMLEVIRRYSLLKAPNEVYKKYRGILESYAEARDQFEHYEERLPGGRKSNDLPNPSDFGSLQGGYFSIGGYKWKVDESSYKKLATIVEDLNKGICVEIRSIIESQ